MQVWNPYLIKDIQKFETVKKFALRMCLKRWSSSYGELFSESDIPRLVDRRRFLCLMYFYKTINGHITTPDNIIVTHYCSYNTRSSSQTTYHHATLRSLQHVQKFSINNILMEYTSRFSYWHSLCFVVKTCTIKLFITLCILPSLMVIVTSLFTIMIIM